MVLGPSFSTAAIDVNVFLHRVGPDTFWTEYC